ncbi:MAG TPA: molybdopterin-dependent oxidoreductase [Terriglobia bacterium]|nr:molybdopterin-dependent oxidoreductase [Terriglobia bacterium]
MDSRVVQIERRRILRHLATVGAGVLLNGGWTDSLLARPSGSPEDPLLAGRPLVRYPEKTDLVLLTSRPPQLETPMHYFDRAITPNEAFFVRYHIFPVPTSVDLSTWRLRVTGAVEHPLELSMEDLLGKFAQTSIVAVNQCSGNGRGHFAPRVFGGQWSNGAMGNAEWTGVRMQDILKMAGLKAGALEVTFNGLDAPAAPTVPDFVKSLTVERIMKDPDVLVAHKMNGAALPMLNGFPARLVVPGWYSTYWVKNLFEITVLDHEFDGFWMKTAYRIPDTPCGCVEPGTQPARTVPINRMNVRSFIGSPADGATVHAGRMAVLKGIAFDEGSGIRQVKVSTDGGHRWQQAELGRDLGGYSFREWSARWTPAKAGQYRLMVRAVSNRGESQVAQPLWNPGGYLRNVIEHVDVRAV